MIFLFVESTGLPFSDKQFERVRERGEGGLRHGSWVVWKWGGGVVVMIFFFVCILWLHFILLFDFLGSVFFLW